MIEVFADVCCPFTWVGLRRLLAARDARGLTLPVRVRAWPLEWINRQAFDVDHVRAEVDALRESVAPDLFTGLDPARFPRTSIPAFGLTAAAYALGDTVGERAALRLREALFEEGADAGDPAVLAALAAELGVSPPSVEATEAAVRADFEEGRERGVIGSPHYFAGTGPGWFCPGLEIARTADGRFVVEQGRERLTLFLDTVLGG